MRAVGETNRGRCAGDFFHRNHVRQIAHARATVFFFYRDAEHAQLTHFAPQVHGELVVFVHIVRQRRDLGLCKIAHRITQCVDVFTELEI